MAETWLKYSDLAEALGITPEAVDLEVERACHAPRKRPDERLAVRPDERRTARQKAIRGRWRRQRGNDGKALVLDRGAGIAHHHAEGRHRQVRGPGRAAARRLRATTASASIAGDMVLTIAARYFRAPNIRSFGPIRLRAAKASS
jgi:hypothetical protein